MEGRLTVCNMSIEAGARAGMIAPDQVTFDYVAGRPYAPAGEAWTKALERWSEIPSDPDAVFEQNVSLNAADIAPMVTWGTSLEDVEPIDGRVPDPDQAATAERREAMSKAIAYMGLKPGMALSDIPVDRVFIGSCTNGRIEDLRSAASVVNGHTVAPGIEAWVVPGSGLVKDRLRPRGSTEFSFERASNGATPAVRSASAPMARPLPRASAAPRPRTATSSAARVVAPAPI